MRLIRIEAESSGGHAYQITDSLSTIPVGWAVVPDDMETPNMPYGDIMVEEIDGVMTVTSWFPREIPETPATPTTDEPSVEQIIDAMLGVKI